MMRFRSLPRLLSTASALVASVCLAGPAFAIDGGALAGRNRLSQATVGIGTLTQGEGSVGLSRCSGVLIAPQLVLTAAHCVRGDPVASAIVLYSGASPIRPLIPVQSIARYDVVADDLPSQYGAMLTLSLDTAILRLATPVRGRTPIPLSRPGLPPAGLRLAGAGFSGEGVGVLKTTHLDPVLVTSTGLIVAETRGSAVCRGDSGGPVVADGPRGPVLWGVTSAVLTSNGVCGHTVVIAPATPRV